MLNKRNKYKCKCGKKFRLKTSLMIHKKKCEKIWIGLIWAEIGVLILSYLLIQEIIYQRDYYWNVMELSFIIKLILKVP